MPQQIGFYAIGFFDVIQHASLLGIACLCIGWWRSRIDLKPEPLKIALWSLAFGAMAAITLLSPIEPLSGLRIDIRTTMIALAMLFGGLPTAVIVTLLEAMIRLAIGGPLMILGTTSIIIAGLVVPALVRLLRLKIDAVDEGRLGLLALAAGLVGPLTTFLTHSPSIAWQMVINAAPINILASLVSLPVFAAIIVKTDQATRHHAALRDRETMLMEANQRLSDLAVDLERRNQDYLEAWNRMEELTTERQAIFDHAPIGIYVKDLDCRYLSINKPAADILNQPVDRLLGQKSTDFLATADAERAAASDRDVIDHGKPVVNEFQTYTPGTPAWILSIKFPLRSKNGPISAIGGFDIDISERKRQELIFQRTALQLRRLQRISRIIYWFHELDADLQPRRLPGSPDDFFDMTGWRAEEVLKTDIYLQNCVHPIDRERMRETYRAFRSGENDGYSTEYNLTCADGRVMPVKVWVERVRFDGDKAGVVVGAMQDISEQRQRERRLLDAMSRAEMAGRVKSEFLANLSHELRTPLNAIIGFSDVLKMTLASDAKARDYLEAINHSGQNLLGTINDLLDIAEFDFGARALSEQMIDVGALVADCLEEAAARQGDTGRQFTVAGAANGIGLFAEESYLRQALGHLLGNAVKFTEPTGMVQVEIAILPSGDLQIAVRDDGCGIAAELIPQLAEPFVHGGTAYARRHGGIGLGLAMCRKIMDLHGGQLEIESRLAQGTRISLVFPVARVAARGMSPAPAAVLSSPTES